MQKQSKKRTALTPKTSQRAISTTRQKKTPATTINTRRRKSTQTQSIRTFSSSSPNKAPVGGSRSEMRLFPEFAHPPSPPLPEKSPVRERYESEKKQWSRPGCKATLPPSFRNFTNKSHFREFISFVVSGRARELKAWLANSDNRNAINLNAQDFFGSTPLYSACKKHFFGIATELLRYGADPNYPSAEGPPLFAAISTADAPLTKLLIRYGADVNIALPSGQTPTMVAASLANSAYLLILLENGAKIDTKDSSGRTPLMYAARRGPDTAVSILLERGADPNALDNNGMNALQYGIGRKCAPGDSASATGQESVVKLLSLVTTPLAAEADLGNVPATVLSDTQEPRH